MKFFNKNDFMFRQASIPNEVSDINSKAEFNGLDPLKALQLLKWSAINLTSIKQSVKQKVTQLFFDLLY